MPGRVFVAYTGDPQSDHELPSKPYIDAVGALVSTLDSRHQALSNHHGTTRAALQQLIANVHGTGTTLPDGASAFVPVASELENTIINICGADIRIVQQPPLAAAAAGTLSH